MRPTSRMRDTVTFLVKTETKDSHRAPKTTYANGATVWGHLKSSTGTSDERTITRGRTEYQSSHDLTVDIHAQAVEGNRVRVNGTTIYDIVLVEPPADGAVNLALVEVIL